jgi:hypothetical protein
MDNHSMSWAPALAGALRQASRSSLARTLPEDFGAKITANFS